MKIIKLFLIFLISLTSNLSFSQNNLIDTLNYEIIYNYQYQINVEDSLNIQTERMVLKIGYNLSEYSSFNRTLINEKLKEMSLSGNVDMRNVPKAKILYKVVKDYKNNEMLFFNLADKL